MEWPLVTYYAGYGAALWLCWGLGSLFRVPMLLNLGFDAGLAAGLFSGWDIRYALALHGFGFLLWALALSHSLTRSGFVFILLLDLGVLFNRLYPELQMAGIGQDFWNLTGTHIIEVFMASIFGVVAAMLFRSTVVAQWHGKRVDVLTNPKKRFLLPIGAWAGMIGLSPLLGPAVPLVLQERRFIIAVNLLVWGWVILELPHYVRYQRLTHAHS